MPYTRIIITVICWMMALPLIAGDFPIRSLGIENGLSNNAVTCIYQDYRGFMWFGTYDGLNRYDGYSFKVYRNKVGDDRSLLTNAVYCMEGDAANNIWVGGQKGACLYDPSSETFTTLSFRTGNGRPVKLQDNVHIIKAIGNGMLVGTNRMGLLFFEKGSLVGTRIPLPPGVAGRESYDVTAIEKGNANDANYANGGVYSWVFIQQAGLFKFDHQTKTLQLVNADIRQANCLKYSGQDQLWLGNEKGLFAYNIQANRYSANQAAPAGKIVNICIDRYGNLWAASDGEGVLIKEKNKETAVPFTSQDGHSVINSNAVYAIYEDAEARKWIGTLRGGVNILEASGNSFRQITFKRQEDNPADNFILSFWEDEQRNLWIGTDGAGLRYWDRQRNRYTEYQQAPGVNNSISSNFVTSIVQDGQKNLWVSTWFGGINRFNPATKGFEHYACFNTSTRAVENNIWLLYTDHRQNLWASATNDGTLYRYNSSANAFEMFDPSIQNLQCMFEDKRGELWGGNYSDLIRIDRDQKKHQVYSIGYTIRCIKEDRMGNFWIGTQEGGLLLFNRKTGEYQRFSTNEGLPNNSILRMLEDHNGNLWLSTYNGLCRFNPRTKTCRNFSQRDGLQSNQFSFNAALALKSGEFAFGGIKGFNLFYPDSIHEGSDAPAIFLTGLTIDNKPKSELEKYITRRHLETIQEITIPFDRAVVSLDFLALAYTGGDKISYAYYLEGWDKDWNYVNNNRTANYSRLQEGHYTFYVKIKKPDGLWGLQAELVKIIVLPPWYRTWWAYTLYVLFALLAVSLYIRYTKRQERLRYEIKLAHLENEKDKELTEKKLSFFTHISHEFRTPLSLIINPLKEMMQAKTSASDKRELGIVYRNARRLLSLVDQLLLFRKAGSGADVLKISPLDITGLCKEVFLCFSGQAKANKMQYHFTAPEERIEIYADQEKLEIVLFNLLSNAFKFTPEGGSIECNISQTAETVTVRIADNGCGIDPANIHRIFDRFQQATGTRPAKTGFGIGLYLAKVLMESHKGSIAVKSELQKGAEFTLTFQKGTAHLPQDYTIVQADTTHALLGELIEEDDLQEMRQASPLPLEKYTDSFLTEKKTILLVDDNAEIRNYLQHIFTSQYVLFTAENGLQGLEMATQHLPDLIISDINMDGLDGLEFCRKVKKSETLGHIPVILLTALSSADTELKGIEGGADAYITKPFDTSLLLAKVNTILKNRHHLQRYFFESVTLQESAIKVPLEYRDFLKKCIQVVEDNLDADNFTIQQFAQAMGMSRSALYNKVKHISGQSLNAFIRSIRLRRAAVLMLKEQLNVNQAAFQVGIGDVRYFREQFVKLFGMTPSEYIKKYRQPFNEDLSLLSPTEEQ